MSFDGIMLRRVIKELNNTLLSTRITKIYQLSEYDLLFQVRGKQNSTFLMSISPQYTRLHQTENTYDKPSHPPMFCMFLRKHIEGSRIEAIQQHHNDRIATFTLKTTNDLGDLTHKYLIFEALGKDANIILLDENKKVLDAIKHTGPFDQQDRTIVPGAQYRYPTDERINPYNEDTLTAFLEKTPLESVKDYLQNLSGISPLFIHEYKHRLLPNIDRITLFKSMLQETNYNITLNKKATFSYLDLTHIDGVKTTFKTTTALFDTYFYERDTADKRKQKAKDLTQFVARQIDKLKNKREKLQKDLNKTDDLETIRRNGEFILSYQHLIKKGDKHLNITDYYTQTPVRIPLDPTKTPIQNSDAYFKRYKKRKTSIPYIKKEMRKAKHELEYFQVIESQIDQASLQDLEEIRSELQSLKYLKKQTKKGKQKRTNITTYLFDNIEIMVGKNNLQNEKITHDLAKHNDVWFHVQNAPGSHVVVKSSFPLKEDIIRAASNLAAYYSKLRHSSSVPVDYTEVRNIKKIPGKLPSFVRYSQQKTIYIDPDTTFIQSLKQKK